MDRCDARLTTSSRNYTSKTWHYGSQAELRGLHNPRAGRGQGYCEVSLRSWREGNGKLDLVKLRLGSFNKLDKSEGHSFSSASLIYYRASGKLRLTSWMDLYNFEEHNFIRFSDICVYSSWKTIRKKKKWINMFNWKFVWLFFLSILCHEKHKRLSWLLKKKKYMHD